MSNQAGENVSNWRHLFGGDSTRVREIENVGTSGDVNKRIPGSPGFKPAQLLVPVGAGFDFIAHLKGNDGACVAASTGPRPKPVSPNPVSDRR